MDMKIEHQRLGSIKYLITEDYPWHLQDRMNLLYAEGWRLVQIVATEGSTRIFWEDPDFDAVDSTTDTHSAFDEKEN